MNKNISVMLRSVLVNIILVITKVFVGFIGHSTALIADGIHSLSDLATDIVAIVSCKLALKPADWEHPYGHGMIESVCCIFISILVLILGINLMYSVFKEKKVIPSVIVIYATMITIVLKFILSSYILRKGKEYNSSLLITSGEESRTDVYSSLIVFISAILSQFSSKFVFLSYSDFVATLIVGLIISITGLKMLICNLKTILGQKETNEKLVNEIKDVIRNYDKICSYNNLNIMQFGSYYKCDLIVFIDGNKTVKEATEIIDELKYLMKKTNDKLKYINIVTKSYKGSR